NFSSLELQLSASSPLGLLWILHRRVSFPRLLGTGTEKGLNNRVSGERAESDIAFELMKSQQTTVNGHRQDEVVGRQRSLLNIAKVAADQAEERRHLEECIGGFSGLGRAQEDSSINTGLCMYR
ncbi:hypothetical protein CRG98_009501, partial [Punica granatum]